ncbi:hypothetical protein SUGI_0835100 [Cryptomeria japonica]|uniref:isoflavone 7-O-glucosyltransferase 1 n=1 Tax=Cryptomeria japonica TaxID=3369 RepID=UPI002414A3CB|nr:isoflavone 7-O-glucosyltransferase 1 [Cryptomeria japonica]GLJ40499.1 hypothetical protein SUGI_0835100 [Cryptomeria japonica]
MEGRRYKPHVALYAGSGWRHLIPCLELAKRLCTQHGFSIIFITPDKYAPQKQDYIKQVHSVCVDMLVLEETTENKVEGFLKLFLYLNVPLCAYIVDNLWATTREMVAHHLNVGSALKIPTYVFFGYSASYLCLSFLKDMNRHQQGDIPGLRFVTASDIPGGLLEDKFPLEHILPVSELIGVRGIIVNSCRDLESSQIGALESSQPPLMSIYSIGPLLPESEPPGSDSAKQKCEKWLEKKPKDSVLFVFLGPALLSVEQIQELAFGLEGSGQKFIWVLKAGAKSDYSLLEMVRGEAQVHSVSELLPFGFEERVRDQGLVLDSAPPLGFLLAHQSIGGFLTHCGWNSTLQSIGNSKPMIAWPQFENEQRLNALVLVKEMKIAVEVQKGMDRLVSRSEVERCVGVLMGGGGEGKDMRMRVSELAAKVRNATTEEGSSRQALDSLAALFMSDMTLRG